MQISDIPVKLPIPFAASAGGGFVRAIPTASQIGVTDGAASLYDGFVPLNATPIGAGGVPPDIKDMNGILREISGWTRWVSAGAPVFFDAVFAAAIGGYPKGSILHSSVTPGKLFVSDVENNTADPDGAGTGWNVLVPTSADAADVIAGVDAEKFMTALAFFGARADPSEVEAGLDQHKYLTPYNLAQALGFDHGTNWFKLPDAWGGFLVQFGTAPASGGEGAYQFALPTPFPAAFLAAVVTPLNTSGSTSSPHDMWAQWYAQPDDLANLHYVAQSTGGNQNYGVGWIAVGK